MKIALLLNMLYIASLGVIGFASEEGLKVFSNVKGWLKDLEEKRAQERAKVAAQQKALEEERTKRLAMEKELATERQRTQDLVAQRKAPTRPTPTTRPEPTPTYRPPSTSGDGSGWSQLVREGEDLIEQARNTPGASGKKSLLQRAIKALEKARSLAPSSAQQGINMKIYEAKKMSPI